MEGADIVRSHQAILLEEMRENSEAIEKFEVSRGMQPNFRNYYSKYPDSRRTRNAAAARRQSLPAFVESLVARFGSEPLVLDVGCGYGTDSLLLARLGCRVTAIDVNEDYIAVARERLAYWGSSLEGVPEPEFSSGHVEDRHDLSGFHGVYSAECLHHCEPVENALLAMRGALVDGGLGLVLESNASNPLVRWQRNRVTTGPRRVLNRNGQDFGLTGNENIKTLPTWRSVFRDCGFDVTGEVYTRHLLTEITGSQSFERSMMRVPGASVSTIHVAFGLRTRQADVIEA